MKDLIGYIAQALVDHPEQVVVTEVEGDQTDALELKVAKEDIGKVIGKRAEQPERCGPSSALLRPR